MERRKFLSRSGIAGGSLIAGVPMASARSKEWKLQEEDLAPADEAFRNGNFEKARRICDLHKVPNETSKSPAQFHEDTDQIRTNQHIEKGEVNLFCRSITTGETHHRFQAYWEFDIEDHTGSIVPYDSVSVSWSETAYRPLEGTFAYDEALDDGGRYNTSDEVHTHGCHLDFPLDINPGYRAPEGWIAHDAEVRDHVENSTTIYGEYIHTWETIPISPTLTFVLPGPARLQIESGNFGTDNWKARNYVDYTPENWDPNTAVTK